MDHACDPNTGEEKMERSGRPASPTQSQANERAYQEKVDSALGMTTEVDLWPSYKDRDRARERQRETEIDRETEIERQRDRGWCPPKGQVLRPQSQSRPCPALSVCPGSMLSALHKLAEELSLPQCGKQDSHGEQTGLQILEP